MKNEKIEMIPLDDLVLPARNPNKHTEQQIERIAASIETYGFLVPLLVTENLEIIAGVGRYEAAERLGYSEAPCLRKKNLTPEQVRAFRIADKRVTETGWDMVDLESELRELAAMEFDLSSTCLDEIEIAKALNLDTDGELKEEKITLSKPFRQTHILLSFPLDLYGLVSKHLEKILKIKGVEYEQSSN